MSDQVSPRRPIPTGGDYGNAVLISAVLVMASAVLLVTHLLVDDVELTVEQLQAVVIVTVGATCAAMLISTSVLSSVLPLVTAARRP